MTISEEINLEDECKIAKCPSVEWDKLDNKTILITGATGLIGKILVKGIMQYNNTFSGNIRVLALVRNEEKAKQIFGSYIEKGWLELVVGDINNKINVDENIDYIIHGASETSSRAFVERPVETIKTAINGTSNVLTLAKDKQIKGMVYMSSMEVYGTTGENERLTEEKMGYINPLAVRSSYSESKRMVENICVSYFSEFGVPVKIARLSQTFGPGVALDDGRVFAEFARCCMNKKNIVLQTKGETKRMYLYTADAAAALLTILTKGEAGTAYNVANPETYCSVKEMAQMLVEEFGNNEIEVVINIPPTPNPSYNPVQQTYLDTTRIEMIGWKADTTLAGMYDRMMKCMV